MSDVTAPALSRRRLFEIIGASVGGAAAYQAMTCLGMRRNRHTAVRSSLDGDPKGASVIVLGRAAGMTTAIELERAGCKRSVLSTTSGLADETGRPGRTSHTELGGATQSASSTPASISIPDRGAFPTTITRS